jgi:hypothetical protein
MTWTNKCFIVLLIASSAAFSPGCGSGSSSTGGGGPIPPPQYDDLIFNITDSCNDGLTVYYKFYDETANLVWPSSTTAYTINYGQTFQSSLSCTAGDQICFGASDATGYWGVGEFNNENCSSCCYTCSNVTESIGLACSAGSAVRGELQRTPLKAPSSPEGKTEDKVTPPPALWLLRGLLDPGAFPLWVPSLRSGGCNPNRTPMGP